MLFVPSAGFCQTKEKAAEVVEKGKKYKRRVNGTVLRRSSVTEEQIGSCGCDGTAARVRRCEKVGDEAR